MAEPIKFTELTNVGELSLSAIMAIVQQQAGELVSLQCSMAQVAELVASGATYQELTTEQKTLISAINEIAAGGGGGGGAYFFAEGQATAAQIRERYNSGLMCFLIANDDTIYPLTAVDAEYIQGERVEGVFFAKAFGYGDNISVNVKYIQNDAGVEVSSVGFTGIANSRITNDMSATNGKIPTDDAVRAYVTEYIRTRLAQKLDLDLGNISAAGEQKIRDIAGGGGFPFPECEFLQTTGYRGVVTPICFNVSTTIEIQFSVDAYQHNKCVIGTQKAEAGIHLTMYNNKWYCGCGDGNEINFGAYDSNINTIIFNRDNKVVFNDEEVGTLNNFANNQNVIWLGCRRSLTEYLSAVKFHRIRIYNSTSGELLHDFIPYQNGFIDNIQKILFSSDALFYPITV